jgi:hypothetical protein
MQIDICKVNDEAVPCQFPKEENQEMMNPSVFLSKLDERLF